MLDFWRGIASLWVVFFHAGGMIGRNLPAWNDQWLAAIASRGGWGVQIFFVISGYCIANAAVAAMPRADSLKRYIVARIRRIYPPAWCALVLVVVFTLVSEVLARQGVLPVNPYADRVTHLQDPIYLFANFTLTNFTVGQQFLHDVCWTLCYEVAFYAIVAVAVLLGSRKGARAGLTLLHGLTAGTLIAQVFVPTRLPFPLDMWAQFGLGVALYDFLSQRTPPVLPPDEVHTLLQVQTAQRAWRYGRAMAVVVFFGTVLLALVQTLLCDVKIGYGVQSRDTLIVAVLTALTLGLLYPAQARWAQSRFVQPLSKVGVFSYSLYLTHMIVLLTVLNLLRRLPIQDGYGYVQLAVAVACTLVFAALFFRLCEKPFTGSAFRKPKEAK
jgi:peptidoglycan/LPS O-acetylase OafA/YrhL